MILETSKLTHLFTSFLLYSSFSIRRHNHAIYASSCLTASILLDSIYFEPSFHMNFRVINNIKNHLTCCFIKTMFFGATMLDSKFIHSYHQTPMMWWCAAWEDTFCVNYFLCSMCNWKRTTIFSLFSSYIFCFYDLISQRSKSKILLKSRSLIHTRPSTEVIDIFAKTSSDLYISILYEMLLVNLYISSDFSHQYNTHQIIVARSTHTIFHTSLFIFR